MYKWSWVIFVKKSKFHDAGGPDTVVSPPMDRFAAQVSTDLPLPAAPLLRQRAVQISWLQWKKRTHWRFTWTLTLLWSYYTYSIWVWVWHLTLSWSYDTSWWWHYYHLVAHLLGPALQVVLVTRETVCKSSLLTSHDCQRSLKDLYCTYEEVVLVALCHGSLQQRAGDLHRDDRAVGDVVLYQLPELQTWIWI